MESSKGSRNYQPVLGQQLDKDGITLIKTSSDLNRAIVSCSFEAKNKSAQYVATRQSYLQNLSLASDKPFAIETIFLSSGPYAGRRALVLDPEPDPVQHFRLLDLPAEIRNIIYKLALTREDDEPLFVFSNGMLHGALDTVRIIPTVLYANRQVHDEAAPILYGSNRFYVSSMGELNAWLSMIGSNAKLLKNSTIKGSRPFSNGSTKPVARLLAKAENLEKLCLLLYKVPENKNQDFVHWMPKRTSSLDKAVLSTADELGTLLRALHRKHGDVKKVLQIVNVPRPRGQCKHSSHDGIGSSSKCECNQLRANWKEFTKKWETAVLGLIRDG